MPQIQAAKMCGQQPEQQLRIVKSAVKTGRKVAVKGVTFADALPPAHAIANGFAASAEPTDAGALELTEQSKRRLSIDSSMIK